MEVVIDSGSIAYQVDLGNADSVNFAVVDTSGTVIDTAGGGGTLTVTTPTVASGSGRSVYNLKVTPTTAQGYVAGQFYNISVEAWTAGPSDSVFKTQGPFKVINASDPDNVWGASVRTLTSGTSYVVLSPGYYNGDITIRKGDSYGTSSGQRITITKPTGANWPSDLASLPWTVKFTAHKIDKGDGTDTATIGPITCTVNSATSVDVPLSTTDTALTLHTKATDDVNGWEWDLQASTSSLRNTLVSGLMTVLDEETTG